MNNTKYYNDSLAYDFEMFMPKAKEQPAEIVKMPARQRGKKPGASKRTKRVSGSVSLVLLCAFIVAAICFKIALRVEISEIKTDMMKAQTNLSALSGEETRLNIEFERMISYNNLETSARALGMKKMDKSQIVYIKVNDTNKAIDADGNLLTADHE